MHKKRTIIKYKVKCNKGNKMTMAELKPWTLTIHLESQCAATPAGELAMSLQNPLINHIRL